MAGWFAVCCVLVAGLATAGYALLTWAQHQRTRTLNLCVVTDFEYRDQRPNWASELKPRFIEINRMFARTGVMWKISLGGEAYPPGTETAMAARLNQIQDLSSCKPADVVLGLTGVPDKRADAIALPFSHALLVSDSSAVPESMRTTILARALAELFGVPAGTNTLIVTDAVDGGIFDARSTELIWKLKDYDFRAGPVALRGRWEKRAAEAIAAALVSRSPHPDSDAHRMLARAFAGSLKYADAARQLREAVRLNPQDASLRYELGMQLEADSDSEPALQELRMAAKLDPDSAWPHAAMGAIYLNSRRVDEAVDEFHAALALNPRSASFQTALGEALAQQPGRVHEAAAAFENAVKLRATEEAAYAGLVSELNDARLYEDAVRETEAEVRQNPASAEAHLRAGLAYAYSGNLSQAEREIRRGLEIAPSNGAAHLVLARVYYLADRYQDAAAELKLAQGAGAKVPATLAENIQRKVGEASR